MAGRGGDFTNLGSLVARVLSNCHSGAAAGMREVMALWPRSVDPLVAANSRPAAFRGSQLLVHVASPVWVQELRFQKESIIRDLNHAAGKPIVSDILFKVGPTG